MERAPIIILPPALLLAVYFLYQPGLGGSFFFDESVHMSGLTAINDLNTALLYILDGKSGPLGRPLSLASFLISARCYPDSVSCFLYENILIHLLNSVLVFWFGWKLFSQTKIKINQPAIFAMIAAVVWSIQPLSVAASLLTIQRMTTLSALFVLAGLIIYLYGRNKISSGNNRGIIFMVLGFIVGAGFSVLAKENGALFPFFILALESTILKVPLYKRRGIARLFYWSFIILPIAVIIGYIAWTFPRIVETYDFRPFDMAERLLTESRVLWLYVKLTLLPRAVEIAPFYDGYPISSSFFEPIATIVSFVCWLTIFTICYFLRKTYPSLLFGLAWFFAGHFIESGVHSLELVFLHRNYLPSIGLIFGILLAARQIMFSKKMKRGFYASTAFYIIFSSAILWNTASLWGEPLVAAKIWYQKFPNSNRSAQYLAQRLNVYNETEQAVITILEHWERNPNSSDIAMQAVQLNCFVKGSTKDVYNKVLPTLDSSLFSHGVSESISKLISIVEKNDCQYKLTFSDIELLIDQLIINPSFKSRRLTLSNLLKHKAKLQLIQGKIKEGISSIEKALKHSYLLDDYMQLARLYKATNNMSGYNRTIKTAISNAPINPILRQKWLATIDKEQKAAIAHKK